MSGLTPLGDPDPSDGKNVDDAVLVPHSIGNVGRVRHLLASELNALAVAQRLADDAVLVVSELVSNALRYARPLPSGGVVVRWQVNRDRVGIEVTDGGGLTRPRPGPPSMSSLGGRGLSIVNSLADAWGVREHAGDVTVWALLRR